MTQPNSSPATGWLAAVWPGSRHLPKATGPRPWPALLAVLLATLLLPHALAQGVAAPTASAPAGAEAARQGIHFVFDASASMCGYLQGNDERRTFLTLARFAGQLRDAERNRRVVLLRQRGAKPAAADLAEPPPEFQALAAAGQAPRGCAPLDGRDSRPVQAFDKPSFAPRARSLVLVSDMLLDEPALEAFVDRFRQWARAVDVAQPHSVGLASLAVNFAGRYYPITDRAHQRDGYVLPVHSRPLQVMWFAVGEEDMKIVRDMLAELGLLAPQRPAWLLQGLQVLPVVTAEPARWSVPMPPPQSAEQFFGPPRHQVVAADRQRSAEILQLCAEARLAEGDLVLMAPKACRDGKPLFDASVEHLKLTLPVRPEHGLRIDGAPAAGVELTMKRETPARFDVSLGIKVPEPALDVTQLRRLSLESDTCAQGAGEPKASAAAGMAACAAQLNGRAYRFEALVRQFALRAHDVLRERHESRKLNLRVTFDR